MTAILLVLVVGGVVVTCVRAYYSMKLLEKDADAWERLQRVEDEKRRRRSEVLGKVLLVGTRTAWGWMQGKVENRPAKKEERP